MPFLKKPLFKQNGSSQNGFSLLELLLIMTLMGVLIAPAALSLSQGDKLAKMTYLKSSRSLLNLSLTDQMSSERQDYYSQFHDSSLNTSLSDSGETLPYMRKVDSTNSTIFQRVTYLYQYLLSTDALTSPNSKQIIRQTSNTFFLRCGSTSSFVDSSGNFWLGDSFAYDVTTKRPGYVTGSSGSAGNDTSNNIVNTTDDSLFHYYREGTGSANLDYSFDVENGYYIVDLYFGELNATVTGTAPNRRLMNVYFEGSLANTTAYSPYETTGGSYRANIQSFDVTVADAVLNLSLRRNASSNHDARLSGIAIYPKREY